VNNIVTVAGGTPPSPPEQTTSAASPPPARIVCNKHLSPGSKLGYSWSFIPGEFIQRLAVITGRRTQRPALPNGETGRTGTTTYRPELDGLRAVAVLAVFGSHIGIAQITGGWIGVSVFFVLSGYLITSILLAEWRRTGSISLRRFYFRRLIRLYPALLLMLALCAIFAPVFGDGGTAAGYLFSATATGLYYQDFVAGLTGSSHGGFIHTWSLAVEEQFYLVWPPILILLLRRGASALRWALAATVVSWTLLALTTQTKPGMVASTYLLPHTRAGELLIGCALALWMAGHPAILERTTLLRRLTWAALIALAVLAVTVGKAGESPLLPLQLPVIALVSALLIAGLLTDGTGPVARALSWSPLVRIGVISYGIYLFHYPVLVLGTKYLPFPWAVRIPIEVAVSLAIAALSYRFIEKPLLRRKPGSAVDQSRPRQPELIH
jgi:peptidoglycan/LPS O-acetylase OafA/YrhL